MSDDAAFWKDVKAKAEAATEAESAPVQGDGQ